MKDFEEVLPKLIKIRLFSSFDENAEDDRRILRSVYDNMSVQKFAKGDIIIKEGDPSEKFCILYSGQIQIQRRTPAGDSIALATLNHEQNIFFGENAIINNAPRAATVIASTECQCIVFESGRFNALCQKEPLLGYRVMRVLADDMARTISNMNRDKAVLYEALFNEIEGGF